jgi:hypothetical protein
MDQAYDRILDAGQFPSGRAMRAFLCPFFCPHEWTYSPDFGPLFGGITKTRKHSASAAPLLSVALRGLGVFARTDFGPLFPRHYEGT